mgnify:CR=1 FL=1
MAIGQPLQYREFNSFAQDGGATPALATAYGRIAIGWDGTNWRAMAVSTGGEVSIAELPAAAAVTVDIANPTTTGIRAHNYVWDGTDWTPLRMDDPVAISAARASPVVSSMATLTHVFDGTDWAPYRMPDAATLADNTAVPGTNLLGAMLHAYDGTNFDLVRLDATLGGLIVAGRAASGGTVTGNPVLIGGSDDTNAITIETDSDGDPMVRTDAGAVLTGFGVPGTSVNLSVTTTSACSGALTVGGYYEIQVLSSTTDTTFCCVTGTSCTAATTDALYVSGILYRRYVNSGTADDVYCCITSSGAATFKQVPITFQ